MRFGLDLPPQRRVYGGFLVYSFCLGSLFPRLPDIRAALGVAEGALGLSLIGTAIGTLISLTFATAVIERVGYRRTILVLIPLVSLFYALATLAPTAASLFLLLLPVGLCIGAIEIILNLEADRTEHQIGHRIMNRAHGFWSLGFFSSGLLGALIAELGVSPQVHLFSMIPLVLIGTVLVLGRFNPAPHRTGTSTEAAPRFAAPTLAILVLVAVTLSALILEGAGADWSAIYMTDEFRVTPFLAGFAVALGALTQAVTRFLADGFVERYSPVLVARALLSVLGLGCVLVFFAATEWMALLGFGLMGVGTSAIFPLAMSAAAQRSDRSSAINVAALAQISFVAFLLGPPLLGFVAERYGIRWSFGLCVPLIALSLLAASALGNRPISHQLE